jgi:ATP-dependent DNA helicase RecG
LHPSSAEPLPLRSNPIRSSSSGAPAEAQNPLGTSIQFIKGVGPRLAQRFAARDIQSVGDALFLVPHRYQDRRRIRQIKDLKLEEVATVTAEVLHLGVRRIGPYRSMVELLLGDDTGQMMARWFNFNAQSFKKRYAKGDRVRVIGAPAVYQGQLQMVHPEIEKLSEDGSCDALFEPIVPIYPEIEGIFPRSLRKIMRRVVEQYAIYVQEILPQQIRTRHGFPSIGAALHQVHFPPADADLALFEQGRSPAHRRVVFEEFFLMQLGLALRHRRIKKEQGIAFMIPEATIDFSRRLFGFELTGGQKRVLGEILSDMASDKPMNRLLQGDVGSGKTAVAVLAACVAARSNAQTAFMAPTEVLAEQHFRRIGSLLKNSGDPMRVAYLSSSVKGAARQEALREITSGRIHLVVGTQALIEESVQFSSLGLCVIDEQHRFGVLQRAKLRTKGVSPDVLVMTATPIPRTLSMTVYGDLDVSILDELPPGRTPVKTLVLKGNQVGQAYAHVKHEVAAGGQAFIVYPLVAESEKMQLRDATQMFSRLGEGVFRGLKLGLLHGRLTGPQKDQIMADFTAGRLQILIATTVIEVGVDIPRASIMVVEHAERFGLSQLHQLRGRVGRGERPALCYLVAHSLASEDARSRLKVMESTNDGFRIAEADLAIRGPGEFLGTRQSGLPSFLFANLARDVDVLSLAREEAFSLIEQDPTLDQSEHQPLRQALWSRWGNRLSLAEVG